MLIAYKKYFYSPYAVTGCGLAKNLNSAKKCFYSLSLFLFDVGEILHIMYHCLLALLYMQEDGEMFEWIPQAEVTSLLRYVIEIVAHISNFVS